MIGKRIFINRIPYRIEANIGYGLHSVVYSGRDLRNGKPVAIKIITFGPGSGNSGATEGESHEQVFLKEIDMLLYLQPLNPYVIRVYGHDYTDRYGIIVMEYGKTLRDTLVSYVLSGRRMPSNLIYIFWSQMVEAIYYMHRIGIVHGDCKPENFIQVGPNQTTLRLIDMGISFELPPHLTSNIHSAAGTPDYVSPEMVSSRIGSSSFSKYGYKADIWALGVILFEMTFGYRPLQGLVSNRAKLTFLGRLNKDIPIPDHPDKNLRDIIRWCLRSNPHRRASIEEILSHPYLTKAY